MPEILDKDATQSAMGPRALIGYGLPSTANESFNVPTTEPPSEESLFHPVKAINDLLDAIHGMTAQMSLLVKDMQRERTFMDRPATIGATIAYNVDYLERKYLYLRSTTALTLNLSTGGTQNVAANVWTNISAPRGTQITVQGGSDASPAVVTIRACDIPQTMDASSSLAVTEGGVWTVQPGNTPNTSPWLTTDANNNMSVPTGAANTVIKNAPGIIATIVVTTTGSGVGNVQIFDSPTTNAGTPLFAFPANAVAGTSYLIFGWAKTGMTAQNVASGPVFTIYFA